MVVYTLNQTGGMDFWILYYQIQLYFGGKSAISVIFHDMPLKRQFYKMQSKDVSGLVKNSKTEVGPNSEFECNHDNDDNGLKIFFRQANSNILYFIYFIYLFFES